MGKPWENHGKTMGKPWENGGFYGGFMGFAIWETYKILWNITLVTMKTQYVNGYFQEICQITRVYILRILRIQYRGNPFLTNQGLMSHSLLIMNGEHG